jgi:hypothetical protein
MRPMKQTVLTVCVLSIILATLFYLGGYILLTGLGALALTAIIFTAFALGARWANKLMTDGARLAIESTSNNDRHDAIKIQALAGLTREAIKAKNESLPPPSGYPALPPLDAIEGDFSIAGIEDEEVEQ